MIARIVLVLVLLSPAVRAQTPALQVPPGAQASPGFDAVRATEAYLATVPPDKKARSDAYFEGGYWLLLWNFLYGSAIFWALLAFGWSAAMRDRAERMTQAPAAADADLLAPVQRRHRPRRRFR